MSYWWRNSGVSQDTPKGSHRAFAEGASRITNIKNCRRGTLNRFKEDIDEAQKHLQIYDFIPSEWMRRKGSYKQYADHYRQKKNCVTVKPLIDEATLERNVGGCKLNI